MLTKILLFVIVALQVFSIYMLFKTNPDASKELEKAFKAQELAQNEATDIQNANALDKDNNSMPIPKQKSLESDKLNTEVNSEYSPGSDTGLSLNTTPAAESDLGKNSDPGSDTTHLNPETNPAPDSHPSAETHLRSEIASDLNSKPEKDRHLIGPYEPTFTSLN